MRWWHPFFLLSTAVNGCSLSIIGTPCVNDQNCGKEMICSVGSTCTCMDPSMLTDVLAQQAMREDEIVTCAKGISFTPLLNGCTVDEQCHESTGYALPCQNNVCVCPEHAITITNDSHTTVPSPKPKHITQKPKPTTVSKGPKTRRHTRSIAARLPRPGLWIFVGIIIIKFNF